MFSCKLCDENFRRESDFKSHKETVWCNECQEEWDCKNHNVPSWCDECDLKWSCDIKHEIHMQQKHELECDIYRTAKIPLVAFEKSTVKANDDEHKTKVDEASVDGEHNVDDTLLKKPMLQTGSNEEIENCSMHSEDISNDDIESLEELSHKVDIKG